MIDIKTIKNILTGLLLLIGGTALAQNSFSLTSPDGHVVSEISIDNQISWSVFHKGDVMLAPSAISMVFDSIKPFGIAPCLIGSSSRSVDEVFDTPIYKRSKVRNNYNELILKFKNDYNIVFRAYDDGLAYRFQYTGTKECKVMAEQAEFVFPSDADAIFSYVRNWGDGTYGDKFDRQFSNSFEDACVYTKLSQWEHERLAFLPVVISGPNEKKDLYY